MDVDELDSRWQALASKREALADTFVALLPFWDEIGSRAVSGCTDSLDCSKAASYRIDLARLLAAAIDGLDCRKAFGQAAKLASLTSPADWSDKDIITIGDGLVSAIGSTSHSNAATEDALLLKEVLILALFAARAQGV